MGKGAGPRGLSLAGPAVLRGAGPEQSRAGEGEGAGAGAGVALPRSQVMPEADKESPPGSGRGMETREGRTRLATPGEGRRPAPPPPGGGEAAPHRGRCGHGRASLGATPKGKPALRLPGYK